MYKIIYDSEVILARNTVLAISVWCLFVFSSSLHADEKKTQPFKIAYAESWAPISIGSARTVTGMLPELMESVIQERMGIPVEHHGFPWARAQQAVKSGEVDAFITTPTNERLEFSRASKNVVFPLRFQPVVRVNSEEESRFKSEIDITTTLKSKRYCDVLGNGWAKEFYRKKNLKYLIVPTLDVCLKHLVQGQTDIIIHAEPVAADFIKELQLGTQVKILPIVMESSPEFPLLVSKKSPFGQAFISDFDETLGEMKNEGLWEKLITSSPLIAK
ncbi:ABC transporter substrate-binding protein [Kiloniella sp. EL199]|uniref:substrate-binding periplasmic protein n=1 Tax=Kiloniella sp. EL199 TaxID=2107581 RepID=UPI000EA2F878|nr:transporter substrate-binding domain-containing protein [Kiloniella sp. EL199]